MTLSKETTNVSSKTANHKGICSPHSYLIQHWEALAYKEREARISKLEKKINYPYLHMT